VIAADDAMIKHAVRQHFSGVDESLVISYFDKLIQVPIRVPPLGTQEVRAYLMLLFVENSTLEEDIKEAIRSKVCVELGETWRGVAKGCRNAIFLAVGTGIGAGILVDGRILRGAHDVAGAVGWLALDRPFQRKYVGCGCFEYHASGEALAKVAAELLAKRAGERKGKGCKVTRLQGYKELTARDVFDACDRGDPVAREVIGQAVEFWGMAVANLVSLFNPEKNIFGGGVFGPGAKLHGDIHAEAKKWAQPISIKQV
jgi:glucokinase